MIKAIKVDNSIWLDIDYMDTCDSIPLSKDDAVSLLNSLAKALGIDLELKLQA